MEGFSEGGNRACVHDALPPVPPALKREDAEMCLVVIVLPEAENWPTAHPSHCFNIRRRPKPADEPAVGDVLRHLIGVDAINSHCDRLHKTALSRIVGRPQRKAKCDVVEKLPSRRLVPFRLRNA